MISGVQDQGIIGSNGTVGFGYTFSDSTQWNLAWDVQAGLTYNVNDILKIDLSWRFLDLGSPQTAVVHCQNTPSCPGAFYTLHEITSQDFRIGLRWLFPAGGFGFASMAQPVFAAHPPLYAGTAAAIHAGAAAAIRPWCRRRNMSRRHTAIRAAAAVEPAADLLRADRWPRRGA